MNFKEFLNESSYTSAIKDEDLDALIKNNVTDPDKFNIYRGAGWSDGSYLIDTTNTTRRSANTMNHYTLIIDKFLAEKGLPLRSKSIICSSDSDSASGFGNVKKIIPFDDALIGIAPDEDLWYCIINCEDSNISFEDFPRILDDYDISDKTYDEVVNGIVDVIANNKKYSSEFTSLFGSTEANKDAVEARLRVLFDLDAIGFKFTNGKEYVPIKTSREIWISGKSIAIDV